MIIAEFTYETKGESLLHGTVECLDFDDAMEALEKMIDWCDTQGFKMRRCDIKDIKPEVNI